MNNLKREWELLYKNVGTQGIPWFITELDHDLEHELTNRKITTGSFLDVGTGIGTQAAELARLGFKITATDFSPQAIALSKKLKCGARFIVDDILDTKLKQRFDYVFDRGCYHVIKRSRQKDFVRNISKIMKARGLLFLKCSAKPRGRAIPFTVTKKQIEADFGGQFAVLSIKATTYSGSKAEGKPAYFCVLERLS
jgi:2-polyprenyl-3-methyl-5-hydroxy-6-metoxy-1,4-benzoquinol methylase